LKILNWLGCFTLLFAAKCWTLFSGVVHTWKCGVCYHFPTSFDLVCSYLLPKKWQNYWFSWGQWLWFIQWISACNLIFVTLTASSWDHFIQFFKNSFNMKFESTFNSWKSNHGLLWLSTMLQTYCDWNYS